MLHPFFVRKDKVFKRIDPMQVMCLLTVKNYTHVCLADETIHMVRSSLSAALKKLPPGMFVKIHRSMVVSIFYIDDIARDHLVIKEKSLPIGRQYYKAAMKKLSIIE